MTLSNLAAIGNLVSGIAVLPAAQNRSERPPKPENMGGERPPMFSLAWGDADLSPYTLSIQGHSSPG